MVLEELEELEELEKWDDLKQDIRQKLKRKKKEDTEEIDADTHRVSISLNVSPDFAIKLKNHAKKTNLPLSKFVHFLLNSYFLHYEDENKFLDSLKIFKEFTENLMRSVKNPTQVLY